MTAPDGAGPGGEAELPAAAVVLTQVLVPEGLAAACAMSKVPVDAVPTPIGALAACRSTGVGDPELAAQVVSQLLQNTPVLLVTQRAGRMTAGRWSGGRQEEEMSPALVLDGAPPEVEQILLGQVRAADLPGAVSSVGMSRWRAARILAAAARAGRRRS
ncbi:hypothetical protein ICW40_17085 [Actinotalea ferrariae]|uniref:hypothetical protein n=1 Tax=Actinotalea ferrariae TaxID=1386098 RepID=UPI001C8BA53E|nr:hypothetical protein [Actinotalea ferrariae]MBX9246509.1 hypothetical protein [Actinotalea ferrariae]